MPHLLTVIPGVPGQVGLLVDNRVPYPESTRDFVKSAKQAGFDIEYAEPRDERRYVGFKALEDWLPVIVVAKELLIGVESGLLVELLKAYLSPAEARLDHEENAAAEIDATEVPTEVHSPGGALLHVDWRVRDGDKESQFLADGDPESVIRALAQFEQSIRDES